MDPTLLKNVNDLPDVFYLIFLNSGLDLDMYGLSDKFTRQNSVYIYQSEKWLIRQMNNHLELIHREDPDETYKVHAPIWVVTDLGGEQETPETWTERLQMYTNTREDGFTHTAQISDLLHELHALDHFKTDPTLMEDLPTRWMRTTIQGYHRRMKDDPADDPFEMTKAEVHEAIWDIHDNHWVTSQFMSYRSDLYNLIYLHEIKGWMASYEEAKQEIVAKKRFKAYVLDEEDEL